MREITFAALVGMVPAGMASAQGSGVSIDDPDDLRFPTITRTESVEIVSFGYMRIFGLGGSAEGGPLRCFQLPDARVKFRLGNECDTYVELGLIATFGDRDDGPNLDLNLRGAFSGLEANSYDDWTSYLVEAWIGYDDAWDRGPLSGARLWAGQRFYYRQDTHIQDFYYWNATGLGIGIEEIAFGRGQLALAAFEHSSYGIETALGPGTPYRRYEIRVEDWQQNDNLVLRGAVDLRFAKEGFETRADRGGLVAVEAVASDTLGGSWSLTFQAGWGAGRSLQYSGDATARRNAVGARAIATYLTNRGDDFAMQATATLEAQNHGAEWASLGARPIWRIGDGPFYGAVELGLDLTRDRGEVQALGKMTGSLMWRPAGPDFLSRPSFRVFASHANWDAPSTDLAGSRGTTFGAQIETWW